MEDYKYMSEVRHRDPEAYKRFKRMPLYYDDKCYHQKNIICNEKCLFWEFAIKNHMEGISDSIDYFIDYGRRVCRDANMRAVSSRFEK